LASNLPDGSSGKLRIVHVFRAPLGGLFRHVVDLAGEQTARGHDVGMFFDSEGLSPRVDEALATIPGGLRLGVETARIRRYPDPSDCLALTRFGRWLSGVSPHVVHGHGSKGGVLARVTRIAGCAPDAARAYTPHGGSFNYRPGGAVHRFYMAVERLLTPLTDVFLFESAYISSRFDAEVGDETRLRRIVVNGLRPSEFQPVAPNADAAEFVYVGELRAVKGVDILLEATARLGARTRPPRLALVGSGPEKDRLKELARSLGVLDRVSFPGVMCFRKAMALGRILVAPSRLESLPTSSWKRRRRVSRSWRPPLEAFPRFSDPFADRLGPCGDALDLARRMANALDQDPSQRETDSADLSRFVAGRFTIESMTDGVLAGYRDALARRRDKTVSAAAQPLQPRAEG
jgi:glycosyltransferase involved in cell wall biosynthesis